jgi:hypothetical protein
MILPERKTALGALSVADALLDISRQIDRLDGKQHPAVHGTEAAAVIHANAPAVAEALLAIAARLASVIKP